MKTKKYIYTHTHHSVNEYPHALLR